MKKKNVDLYVPLKINDVIFVTFALDLDKYCLFDPFIKCACHTASERCIDVYAVFLALSCFTYTDKSEDVRLHCSLKLRYSCKLYIYISRNVCHWSNGTSDFKYFETLDRLLWCNIYLIKSIPFCAALRNEIYHCLYCLN